MTNVLRHLATNRLGVYARQQGSQRFGIFGLKAQIASTVTRLTKTVLELVDQNAQRRVRLCHKLTQNQTGEDSIALGHMRGDADTTGFFAAHEDAALLHLCGYIFETDRRTLTRRV